MFSDQGGVPGILGVHCNRGVSRNCFGTGRGDGQELLLLSGHGHPEVIEETLLLLHDDFLVRKGSP